MALLEVLHGILDSRGVTLGAGEWSDIRNALREEKMYAVIRYIMDRECSEEQTTDKTLYDYGERQKKSKN